MIESELDMLFEYIDLQINAKLMQHNNLEIANRINDRSAAIRHVLLTLARNKILDNIGKEMMNSTTTKIDENDLVYRLSKRAEIRRQIATRKSIQEGKPDRISDLLEEAAREIESLRINIKTNNSSYQK